MGIRVTTGISHGDGVHVEVGLTVGVSKGAKLLVMNACSSSSPGDSNAPRPAGKSSAIVDDLVHLG
eukprot:3033584-Pleurochrysis_carterae.AAC.1